jgi:hypothetical protein
VEEFRDAMRAAGFAKTPWDNWERKSVYWSLPTSARKTLVKFAQLLASGLPGNLFGEGIGGVKSGRHERRCNSGCSV